MQDLHDLNGLDLTDFDAVTERIFEILEEEVRAPNVMALIAGAAEFAQDDTLLYMPILAASGRPETSSIGQVERCAWDEVLQKAYADWIAKPEYIRLSTDEMRDVAKEMGWDIKDRATTGFTFQGMWIHNPMISECGRFEDDEEMPAYYGFDKVNTGGGCMAWMRTCENGDCLLITSKSGENLPADWTDAIIGRYDADGNVLVDAHALSFQPPEDGAGVEPSCSGG